ncbi:sugar phosphate isomerase/epimerase family protein [Phycisphaera mikurensis]|uniref:Xylose isomerase-like TIM barrel domain-containing protein n=1 Tax=Phycisphaera mikurensis (strain NBRC 102666 / KCTC 22515 / FYK2301M01) TaxID=1142394 RepID=I0ICM6_PHYMF|nr:sugar phosphate isomerase/epimerase family protein [Phycisphaera mikurensis]MBB6442111.1 sugar phosphate isomerase/epimerase [Phycisphaera mikurensis]BAM03014.1 hypothetical protein PSMK_08550 [Phycisphaera mikurensis NBRC 102666]
MPELSSCAVHTATLKPWDLATTCSKLAAAGVAGVSIWRDKVAPDEGGVGLEEAVKIVKSSGLAVPAYVRGGFFPAADAGERRVAVDHNKSMLDEAAALGAEQVVLVVGAVPSVPLNAARVQVAEGIAACVEHAEAVGVKLAIEPLHPMYAADKSCINTIASARAVCDEVDHPIVGVAVDVYHVWWDPDLEAQIAALGEESRLFGFHVCDWRVPTRDLLLDRALMGDGCIDVAGIRKMVERAGFAGLGEVEIFSTEHWAEDQDDYLDRICGRFVSAS